MVSFILLCVASPMETGNQFGCRQRGGYCTLGRCPRIHISLGRCSIFYACCKNKAVTVLGQH
uniref:Beta-defensin-like domain-containing protein n=1 Tax=Calidris pygmaea TaxID=425635 RepID=A0A8C3KCK1_9CHAR